MADSPNYLLGYGERLAESVTVGRPGGPKVPPYSMEEAAERVTAMATSVAAQLGALPSRARPYDHATAALTLHPEYLAKSYYPSALLSELGLTAVGSRSVVITPSKRSKGRPPEPATATELIVEGSLQSFNSIPARVARLSKEDTAGEQLASVERLFAPPPESKVRSLGDAHGPVFMEAALHAGPSAADQYVVAGFREYAEGLGVSVDMDRTFYAGRLCFLRIHAPADRAQDIAAYSFLRVLRAMPTLRMMPVLLRVTNGARRLTLPSQDAVDPGLRVAIFDGGLRRDSPLLKWATPYEPAGLGPATAELTDHGEAVTSAFLFGSASGPSLSQPPARVDHFRVLDQRSQDDARELYEVLERIVTILDSGRHEYVSLSIGPALPVDDDEVHAWTAVLDEQLAEGRLLATIAAGNTGEEASDPAVKRTRVQVPSDCVNGVTVGACDSQSPAWRRASYSSVGPGRSPGIIKPDLVAFGGSDAEPFWVLQPGGSGELLPTAGTSFASPLTLRLAAEVRAHFGGVLSPLAIRALLLHTVEVGAYPPSDVGRGRIASGVEQVTLCPDGVVRVVYQDSISAAKYRRVKIPLPDGDIVGKVTIRATCCYATQVEPEHPGSYTRAGLEVNFRPHAKKVGTSGKTAKSVPFISARSEYAPEQQLRADAFKWETCLQGETRMLASSLDAPVLDVHYLARQGGRSDTEVRTMPYALIIDVAAPKTKDFYDRVVRKYRAQLEALRPVIAVQVRPTT